LSIESIDSLRYWLVTGYWNALFNNISFPISFVSWQHVNGSLALLRKLIRSTAKSRVQRGNLSYTFVIVSGVTKIKLENLNAEAIEILNFS
jgi:hypothetical protein